MRTAGGIVHAPAAEPYASETLTRGTRRVVLGGSGGQLAIVDAYVWRLARAGASRVILDGRVTYTGADRFRRWVPLITIDARRVSSSAAVAAVFRRFELS